MCEVSVANYFIYKGTFVWVFMSLLLLIHSLNFLFYCTKYIVYKSLSIENLNILNQSFSFFFDSRHCKNSQDNMGQYVIFNMKRFGQFAVPGRAMR